MYFLPFISVEAYPTKKYKKKKNTDYPSIQIFFNFKNKLFLCELEPNPGSCWQNWQGWFQMNTKWITSQLIHDYRQIFEYFCEVLNCIYVLNSTWLFAFMWLLLTFWIKCFYFKNSQVEIKAGKWSKVKSVRIDHVKLFLGLSRKKVIPSSYSGKSWFFLLSVSKTFHWPNMTTISFTRVSSGQLFFKDIFSWDSKNSHKRFK